MSISTTTRRFSLAGALTAAAIGLTALTVPLSPAKAQGYVGIWPFGFSVGTPPIYYNYPNYSYPAPGYTYNYYTGTYYPNFYYPNSYSWQTPGYYSSGYYYPTY